MGKILNDDTAVSIGNVSVTEGNSGTINANFKVSLSAAAPFPVTVRYATADGTATAGSDYVSTSGTLTIPAGSTSGTVAVPVVGDTLNEANETFTVKLSSPTNAIVATATGTGTILNDDPVPTLSIGNVSLTEGNSGTKTATFTVALSAVSGQKVTVHFATANGTATAGSDYASNSGTLTFNPGSTKVTIAITIYGDRIVEPNETFFVNLSSPVNATLTNSHGGRHDPQRRSSLGGTGRRRAPDRPTRGHVSPDWPRPARRPRSPSPRRDQLPRTQALISCCEPPSRPDRRR